MKKTEHLEALCFGSLTLVVGALVLSYALLLALFQPHACSGILDIFSCAFEDDWLRPLTMQGMALCLVGYIFIRRWTQPRNAYMVALLVIVAGAIWCLTQEDKKFVFIPIAMAITAFLLMRSAASKG